MNRIHIEPSTKDSDKARIHIRGHIVWIDHRDLYPLAVSIAEYLEDRK